MTGRQELASSVWAFDHQIGFALAPLASHHHDQPPYERMVRCRNPYPFDVAEMRLLSLSVSV